MGLFESNKKLTVARQNGFEFNPINKVFIEIYRNLSHMNIHYYLKLGIPIMHRHFFRKLSHNHDYIQIFCKDKRNPFHFACR